ncbi:MAG: hypothetical protein K8S87_06575 [Planctomycetes bacterium]|nr:hypothetical protein [Planctomycetota bacterium]
MISPFFVILIGSFLISLGVFSILSGKSTIKTIFGLEFITLGCCLGSTTIENHIAFENSEIIPLAILVFFNVFIFLYFLALRHHKPVR